MGGPGELIGLRETIDAIGERPGDFLVDAGEADGVILKEPVDDVLGRAGAAENLDAWDAGAGRLEACDSPVAFGVIADAPLVRPERTGLEVDGV